jgi:hypothetical protein
MSGGAVVDVIAALALPADTRVERRVPKKLLLEQGAPTAGDKRQIQEGIEDLIWVAALKPNNIGVPAFRDEAREYLEIAVLTVALRDIAKASRLTELIHRVIPYPGVVGSNPAGGASFPANNSAFGAKGRARSTGSLRPLAVIARKRPPKSKAPPDAEPIVL